MELKKENIKLVLNRFKPNYIRNDFLDLINKMSLGDVLFIVALPVVMIFLMLLPPYLRESLQLHLKDLNLWQIFTASFIHQDWQHLIVNLNSYLLFIIPSVLFVAYTKQKWLYFKTVITIFLTLPLIITLIEFLFTSKLFLDLLTSSGSSGIISALLGLFPIVWINYLSERSNKKLYNTYFLFILIF